jgi:Domain of unknown function (DUF4145)
MRWWELLRDGACGRGETFDASELVCPYCRGRGSFSRVFRQVQPDESNHSGGIYSDVWKCAGCGNCAFVIWRTDPYPSPHGLQGAHRFSVAPSRRPDPKDFAVSENLQWPKSVGDAYVEACKSIATEAWNAAAAMARRAVQAATRAAGAKPGHPVDEIKQLQSVGKLTTLLADWANEVRLLGNVGAHPGDDVPVTAADARQVTDFAFQLATHLFTFPAEIEEHRKRRKEPGA